MSEAPKKTPSPKVIASYMLREVLTNAPNNFNPEQVSSLVSSRVSEAKYDKVKDQFEKITNKFRERIDRTIEKHEAPPKKSKGQKSAEKAMKKLKKKNKKKDRD